MDDRMRVLDALLGDARDAHRLALEIADQSIDGHSALEGALGPDTDCMRCALCTS